MFDPMQIVGGEDFAKRVTQDIRPELDALCRLDPREVDARGNLATIVIEAIPDERVVSSGV